jgi:hypothetical protein
MKAHKAKRSQPTVDAVGTGVMTPNCTRYLVRVRVGDWWAARRDRRGLRGIDIESLARAGGGEPAAHLRWIRARSAQFAEQDRIHYADMERALAPDIERLTELVLSLDRLRREAAEARTSLEEFPAITEAELTRRTVVEAEDPEPVIRARRTKEYEARRRPVAVRSTECLDRYTAAQRGIAERTARIHHRYDTTRQQALALYAYYTQRVETYLRILLHRNPDREAAMELLPSPVIVRPDWFDRPCPWPAGPVTAPTEEVSS